MRAIKAVKKTSRKNVFYTGGVGGRSYTEWKVGETYTYEGDIELCESGFHFYRWEDFVFGLTLHGIETVFIEIEVLGDIKKDTEKLVTNKLKVLRYVPVKEWRNKIHKNNNSGNRNSGNRNSGNWNSGNRNSGNRNSGDGNNGNRNSGNRNSGDGNSGNWNSGNWNSGNWNSGNLNSGAWNSGNRNSGARNSGNWNSGNWNSCNNEAGCFNSIVSKKIRVFNTWCDRLAWENIEKPSFIYFNLIDGKTYKECFKNSWDNASLEDRRLIENLPNFNWEVFTEISGIEKPEDWD